MAVAICRTNKCGAIGVRQSFDLGGPLFSGDETVAVRNMDDAPAL